MDERRLSRDTNLVVARLFEEIAQSLEVAGEQGHRLRAYRRAAHTVAAASEPVERLAAEGRLRELPGVGSAMSTLINEFLETGSTCSTTTPPVPRVSKWRARRDVCAKW